MSEADLLTTADGKPPAAAASAECVAEMTATGAPSSVSPISLCCWLTCKPTLARHTGWAGYQGGQLLSLLLCGGSAGWEGRWGRKNIALWDTGSPGLTTLSYDEQHSQRL